MKTVFTDIGHVAHLWASQAQDNARNTGNFFYEKDVIYSYGHHFPIAQIYNKDNHIVFLTTRTYSNTTTKHIRAVRYAINHKKVFHVPNVELNGGYTFHKENLVAYFNTLEELIGKQKKARVYNYMGNIKTTLIEMQEYVELFSLKSLLSKDEKKLLSLTKAEELFEGCDFSQLREQRKKKETDKQREACKKRLHSWTGCKLKYKEGKVYLRVKDDKIETSMSADVPIREAQILYNRIKEGKDVKGFQIGYHTVISMNGVLKIGCHQIERDEIDRIATALNW